MDTRMTINTWYLKHQGIKQMKSKEIIEVGFMPKTMDSGPHLADGKKHQSNTVFSTDRLSPCICAGIGVKDFLFIITREGKHNE